jgi:hypothetical protein
MHLAVSGGHPHGPPGAVDHNPGSHRPEGYWTAPTTPTHKEQASMTPRFIWRNNHAYDERLRRIINRANVG